MYLTGIQRPHTYKPINNTNPPNRPFRNANTQTRNPHRAGTQASSGARMSKNTQPPRIRKTPQPACQASICPKPFIRTRAATVHSRRNAMRQARQALKRTLEQEQKHTCGKASRRYEHRPAHSYPLPCADKATMPEPSLAAAQKIKLSLSYISETRRKNLTKTSKEIT